MRFESGNGKIFDFRPGHEAFPTYFHQEVLTVIGNGVRRATFAGNSRTLGDGVNVPPPIEKLD